MGSLRSLAANTTLRGWKELALDFQESMNNCFHASAIDCKESRYPKPCRFVHLVMGKIPDFGNYQEKSKMSEVEQQDLDRIATARELWLDTLFPNLQAGGGHQTSKLLSDRNKFHSDYDDLLASLEFPKSS